MAQTKAQLLGPVVGDVVMDVSTLSLDAEGNKVGIGHTEPDLTLHVNGVNGLPSSSGSTATGHLTLRNKAGNSSHGMFMGVSHQSPWGSWIQAQDANNNATNYPLLLNPNGGNVGVGVSTPRYTLDVHGGNLLVSGSSAGNLILEDRGVADGSRPFTIFSSDGGNFLISRSNRNASGTTTSSALAFRIASNGNVRIGVSGGDVGILNVHAETDGNLCVRDIASVTGSSPAGSGVVLDVLNDASNTIKDLALRGSTLIFRNASGETARIDSNGKFIIPDSGIFVAGTDNDLQISHNGTDAFIQNNTGTVKVRADAVNFEDKDSTIFYQRFINGAGVKLYYAGTQRFETTSTGVNVGGEIYASGSDGVTFKLDCPNDYSNSSSIIMARDRAEIKATIDASGGNPGGSMVLRTRNTSGTMVDSLTIDNTQGVTINSLNGTHALSAGDGGDINFRVTSTGRVLVGHHNEVAGAYDNSVNTKQLQIINGSNSGDQGLGVYSYSTAGWAPRIELAASRSGSFGGHTVVTNGQSCGLMVFNGSDGTNFSTASMIGSSVDGNPANDSIPGALSLYTSPGAGLYERLRIDSTGKSTAISTHSNGAVNDGIRITTRGTYSSSNSINAGPAISFGQFHNTYPTWKTAQIAGIRKGNNWHGALAFYTNNGASETDVSEKVRITAGGDVGIGDNNPDSSYGTNLSIYDSGTAGARIKLADSTSGKGSGDGFDLIDVGGTAYLINRDPGAIVLSTSNTERLRIDSAGDMVLKKSNNAYKHPQFEIYNTYNGGWGGAIKFSGYMSSTKYQQALIKVYGGSNLTDGSLAIETGNGADKLRITSSDESEVELYCGGTDENYATVRGKYSPSNEYNRSEIRFGVQQNANGRGFIALATGTNSTTERFRITYDGQPKFSTTRAMKFAGSPTSTSMFQFRLAIDMIGNTAYTIRLRGFSNGAHHVRLMASHWTGGYQLVKESYYYTDTYSGLSELSVHNVTSGAQGAWSVSRPTSGQTGYTTDLIITKSAGTYQGGHKGMIDIITPTDLYLVSIT